MSSEKKITITVCIPTYNQAAFLEESLQSVLDQTYPVDEIIISDDASTDGTEAICREFAQKYPSIRYIRQPKNLGIGGNVQFVMNEARTTYVARLDSDDRYLPGYVESLLEALEKFPEASYAHSNAWQIDEKGNRVGPRTLYRKAGFQTAHEALIGSLRGYRVAANTLMFRRSSLAKMPSIASFDYCEDYYFSVALARAGFGNVFIPEAQTEARVWFDKEGVRTSRTEQILRGLIRIFKEQIEPAFEESGLPPEMVSHARRSQAISNAVFLDSSHASPEQKKKFKPLLIELGDSFRLRLLIGIFDLHLGFLILAYRSVVDEGRKILKKYLSAFRQNPST